MRTSRWITAVATMALLACSTGKPGEGEVTAWLEEHGAFWTGAREVEQLNVLWRKDHVGDSIRDVVLIAQMQLSQRRDTGDSMAVAHYQYWADFQDSLDAARPKKQLGWTCELDGEAHTLSLFLNMDYEVDSVALFRWDSLSSRTIYP